MGRGLHFATFFLTSISTSIWTQLLHDFGFHFGSVFDLFQIIFLKMCAPFFTFVFKQMFQLISVVNVPS